MKLINQYKIILLLFIPFQLQATITIDQLTLDQKIGQLFMVAAVADEERDQPHAGRRRVGRCSGGTDRHHGFAGG